MHLHKYSACTFFKFRMRTGKKWGWLFRGPGSLIHLIQISHWTELDNQKDKLIWCYPPVYFLHCFINCHVTECVYNNEWFFLFIPHLIIALFMVLFCLFIKIRDCNWFCTDEYFYTSLVLFKSTNNCDTTNNCENEIIVHGYKA